MNLISGDCLTELPKIADGSIDLVLTDPPYGTTACAWDSIIPLEPMWTQLKRVIKPNGAIVMTASQPFTTKLISSNMAMFKYEWIWEKNRAGSFVHAKNRPLKAHENVLIFSKGAMGHESLLDNRLPYNPQMGKGRPYVKKNVMERKVCDTMLGVRPSNRDHTNVNNGERHPRSVIKVDNPNRDNQHPTQKPVKLMEYLILTYTNAGETVLDFTMGSGTTGVACCETGRDFIGIELDEGYFKIAQERIKKAQAQPRLF